MCNSVQCFILCALIILVIVSVFHCKTTESFKNTTAIEPVYRFALHTPLYIRKNGQICYYNGKITKLPTTRHPYYTVSYTDGEHNPNGKQNNIEDIHQAEFYTGGGDSVRIKRRVLRNQVVDVQNKQFVSRITKTKKNDDEDRVALHCFPRKTTANWNVLFPTTFSAQTDLRTQQRALINTILTHLFENTYVNIHVQDVNPAPSILSDTHTPPTTTHAPDDLFLDYNGCRPHLPHTDSRLTIHNKACRLRYRFVHGVPLEMHLLGSDNSGASLTVLFQQCVEGLHRLFTKKYGEHSTLKKCLNTLRFGLKHYKTYRKRIHYQQIYNILKPLREGSVQKNLVYTMYRRQRELMQIVQPELSSKLPNHKQKWNRLYLLPLIRNRALDVSAKNAIASFVSDHDATMSVAKDNNDITAEVSFAAKQSTTTTRLAVRPETPHNRMLANTLQDKQLYQKDHCFLSTWLYIFCMEVMPTVVSTAVSTIPASSSTASATASTESTSSVFSEYASKLVIQCARQLFGLLSTEPIRTLISDPLFESLRKALVAKTSPKAHVKQLFSKLINNEATTTVVKRAEWQHRQVVGTSTTNGKNMQIQMPWNSVVFGASLVAHYDVKHRYAFKTYTPQSTSNLNLTVSRISANTPRSKPGWRYVVYAHMNKRITVVNTLPTTFMPQLLIGNYTFGKDVYEHLNHHPLVAPHPENTRKSYDNTYKSLSKYKSTKQNKCFFAKCRHTDTSSTEQTCCKGATDVADCKASAVQKVNCAEPPRSRRANEAMGKCHTNEYNINQCTEPFTQRIQNCRNGLLIIEPFDETQGLSNFWDYITHPTESGVRLRLLNKMVKTLVLQVNEFGHPGLGTQPSLLNRDTKPLEMLHRMHRALTFLYKYYIVVGLHAPASLSVVDNEVDTTMMHQVKATQAEDVEQIVYQTYKCVNITFRRKYENSRLFYVNNIFNPTMSLQTIKKDFSKNNSTVFHFLLSYYVHPAMLNTILAFQWHDPEATSAQST